MKKQNRGFSIQKLQTVIAAVFLTTIFIGFQNFVGDRGGGPGQKGFCLINNMTGHGWEPNGFKGLSYHYDSFPGKVTLDECRDHGQILIRKMQDDYQALGVTAVCGGAIPPAEATLDGVLARYWDKNYDSQGMPIGRILEKDRYVLSAVCPGGVNPKSSPRPHPIEPPVRGPRTR